MTIQVGAVMRYDRFGWPHAMKPGTVIVLPRGMDPATTGIAEALAHKIRTVTTEPHVYEPKRAWWRRVLGR